MNIPFLKKLSIFALVMFFASCDKEYNSIGTDIVGNEHFGLTGELFKVKAYNQKIDAIQSNGLIINQLGYLNSPVFGETKANFVTQLNLGTASPVFKSHTVIDSVILTVPYFSHKDVADATKYVLDSVYGTDAINLKVYRNGYYLRENDPVTGFQTPQKYYSNEDNSGSNFNGNKIGGTLNNKPPVVGKPNENTSFYPDNKEYVKFKTTDLIPTTEVESRSSPRMRLHLDETYFKTQIIEAPTAALATNNAFKEYFRGLYFQAENISNKGVLMSLDFSKGDVTIYYKQDVTDGDTATTPKKEMAALVLTMSGVTANLLNNTDNASYSAAVNNPNTVLGDSKIYLKGGQGSKAFIDIFSDPTELAVLKAKKPLINDATLTFTVDRSVMNTNLFDTNKNIPEPLRIYLYDTKNNRPILDYFYDNSSVSSAPKYSKYVHGGIVEKNTDKKAIQYKIRLTEFVNNIVRKDSVNNRLGLIVTESIAFSANTFLKTPILSPKKFDRLPVGCVMNPLGTVFYGTGTGANDIKFNIYYTTPN
jgi:Domain of unknown function (DUF4270)